MTNITKNNIHLVDIIAQLINEPVGVVYEDDVTTYVIISSNITISDDILIQANEQLDKLTIEQENIQKLTEAKAYLVATDWIITKIGETQLLNTELVPSLLEKYKIELAKRSECRELINSLNKM
jgi:hypothetical protein